MSYAISGSEHDPALVLREHVAEEIRALMARRRMNATELSMKAGLTQSSMSRKLRAMSPFDTDELLRIAVVLDAQLATLLPAKCPQRDSNARHSVYDFNTPAIVAEDTLSAGQAVVVPLWRPPKSPTIDFLPDPGGGDAA